MMEQKTQSFKKSFSGKVSKTSTKILEVGPLESVFPGSESKILDFMATMRDFDYSISDISKNSGVGFKTTLGIVHKFERQNVFKNTRPVGKALMYKLNLESSQAESISKLAFEIAKKRISASIKSDSLTSTAKTAQAWKRMKARKAIEV